MLLEAFTWLFPFSVVLVFRVFLKKKKIKSKRVRSVLSRKGEVNICLITAI